MTKILVLLTLLSPLASQAETFSCAFTEPFDSFEYSTTSRKLIFKDDGTNKVTVYDNVSFRVAAAGEFILTQKGGKRLATLKLTNQGSDGMSEITYPYEVQTTLIGSDMANSGIGGCSSTLLSVKQNN